MPFKSERQRRYLHANHPEIAARWEREEKRMKYSRPKKRRGVRPDVTMDGDKTRAHPDEVVDHVRTGHTRARSQTRPKRRRRGTFPAETRWS